MGLKRADKTIVTQSFPISNATHLSHHASGVNQPGHPASAQPLTPEHHAQIARAQQQRKKINRALKIASFNAWSFTVFAAFSLLFALFSVSSLIAGVALAGLAWNEFRGRRRLQQLDLRGPSTLGTNQIACCLLIALYCGVQLYNALTGPGPYAQAMDQSPELATALQPMEEMIKSTTLAAYALILIVGVSVQGATAWYYFSRKRWLNEYLQQTPDWVVDLDRVRSSNAA